ncbi:hypothetical protein ABQF34_29340 [Mycolicibacterium boenickei]
MSDNNVHAAQYIPQWPAATRAEAVDPGRLYHQLARTAAHRWWRPLVGTAEIFLMTLGAGAVAFGIEIVLYGISAGTFTGLDLDALGPTPIFGNAALNAAFSAALGALVVLAMLLAVFLAAKEVQKRSSGTLSSVAGRLRWRWLAVLMALAVGCCAVLVGAALLLDLRVDTRDASRGWEQISQLPLAVITVVAFEYLFRG